MAKTGYLTLRRILVARGLIDPAAPWHPLAGGRTNRTWKIGLGRKAVVCKVYRPDGDTPLFANDARAEAAVLTHLTGQGLAPDLLAFTQTHFGICVIYRFVEGELWRHDAGLVARMLGRLHELELPNSRDVPHSPHDHDVVASSMLSDLKRNDAAELSLLKPSFTPSPCAKTSLLHGDPVPANIIMAKSGPVMIDWQCPKIGDPCEDIAIFLSPAMHHLYGTAPLTRETTATFLKNYPCQQTVERYARLSRFFHWRMAVYCAWKAQFGAHDYAAAQQFELEALKSAQQV